MFKIRGADQKEYGPVTGEVLRQWVAEGRLTAETPVQAEGSDEWKPLGSFPEFGAPPAALRPAAAPALSAPQGPAKTSGLAIASLVCGVLGCLGITGLIGLILGIVALGKINRSQGRLGGKGLAIAGICVSAVMMLFAIPFLAGLTLPAFARARGAAQTISCVNNLKQLNLALIMYANDNKDTLPAAAKWCDAIKATVDSPRVLKCQADSTRSLCSYAFNAKLSGRKINQANPQTVLIFEANGGWNISGGQADMITRHAGTYTVGFVDGSVRQVRAADLPQLRWDP